MLEKAHKHEAHAALSGTAEKVEDQEPEVYEVVNLHKLKAFIPNLRICNFFGVSSLCWQVIFYFISDFLLIYYCLFYLLLCIIIYYYCVLFIVIYFLLCIIIYYYSFVYYCYYYLLLQVTFLSDEHLESLSTNCSFLECVAVNFCKKVNGSSLKQLLQRCKKLKSLLMDHCLLDSQHMTSVRWEETQIEELNITATELSAECLTSVLTRLPHLRWLSAGYLECFTNQVHVLLFSSEICVLTCYGSNRSLKPGLSLVLRRTFSTST